MTASEWTDGDRALLMAFRQLKASLCPGCGVEKSRAWHPDMDGWYEVHAQYVCHVCTAEKYPEGLPADAEPITFVQVTDVRDYDKSPLPPFPDQST